MPTDAPIQFSIGNLPEGYCFTNWQQTLEDFFAAVSGYLPGAYNTFNYGSQTPAAEDRGKPWFHLNSDGSPDKWYVFFNGSWVSPHPISSSDDERRIWVGSLADLKLKDGGEDAAVTDTAGPFWEEATGFRARVPLGVGTLADSGVAVAVAATGGNDEIELEINDLPEHTHAISDLGDVQTGTGGTNIGGFQGTGTPIGDKNTEITGAGNPINIMNPYIGVYFIKRTARVFYSLPG